MIPNPKHETRPEPESNGPYPAIEGFILSLTLLLAIFPAWILGGTARRYLTVFPWIAAAFLLLFLLAPYLCDGSHSHRCLRVREHLRTLARDPLVYFIAAFLLYLLLQWWNAGRFLVMTPGGEHVTLTPPFIPWLPGAADKTGSWDLVICFFPALVALLMVRHGLFSPRKIRILFEVMLLNATLLAILGLAVPVLFKNAPAWLAPILPHQSRFSFATFPYSNQAGTFFLLHLGLACGLFFFASGGQGNIFEKTFIGTPRRGAWTPAKLLVCFHTIGILLVIVLLFYAIHMTRCRFAIYFSWITVIFFAVYLLFKTIKKINRHQPGQLPWGTLTLTVIAVLVMTLFVLSYISNKKKYPDLLTLVKPAKIIEKQWNSRLWALQAAVKIREDNPLFGIGGGGYKKCLLPYVGRPQKPFCLSNVHNEPLQFLCELGIIGMGLLLGVFIFLVVRIFTANPWNRGFRFFVIMGLVGVVLHSLVDLPFRSPPVLMAFGLVMAGLGINRYPQRQRERLSANHCSTTAPISRYVYFYTLLGLLLIMVVWRISAPLRRGISGNIVREVERQYIENRENSAITGTGPATPGKSLPSTNALLRSLWWAKLFYSEYQDPHLLSARIYFDLYRETGSNENNKKMTGKYLEKALKSSLEAGQYAGAGDIDFIRLHAAILDALGYYLEESLFIKGIRLIPVNEY